MRSPDQEFYLPPLRSHIVYAFYDDDRKPLYVGLSKVGMGRPFGLGHRMKDKGTILKVWFCNNEYEAIDLEATMITTLRPQYNIYMNCREDSPKPPATTMVEKFNLVSVEKLNYAEIRPVVVRERLPGHKPGCGCDPDDWLSVVPDSVASDIS